MMNLWAYLVQCLLAMAVLTALGAALGSAVRQQRNGSRR